MVYAEAEGVPAFAEQSAREKWWTERGSQRYLGDEESLEAAVKYVLECQ